MISRTIELNFNDQQIKQTSIIVNQANVGSIMFNYKISDGSDEIKYLEYSKAEMIFRKSDGLNVVEDGLISEDGISYTLNHHIFDIPDVVKGQINLHKDDTITATLHYSFKVAANLLNIIGTSTPYVDALEEMVAKYQHTLDDFPNLSVLGSFDTLENLKTTHPSGASLEPRGGFFVTSFRPSHYFYWDLETGWTDIGPIQGEQGALWFNLSTATSIAPSEARIDDIVQNVGEDTYIIGGVSMEIGDIGRITSLSPFAVAKEGNNRGAQGTLIFPLTAATTTAPAGSRINDKVINTGTTTHTIGGLTMAIGDIGKITSLSPFTVVNEGNIRGPVGPATTPIADNLTTDSATQAASARQAMILDETKLNKAGGTISGNMTPDTANTRDLGSPALSFRGVYSKSFSSPITNDFYIGKTPPFTNGIANEKVDVVLGKISISGTFSVKLVGGWINQNAVGLLEKTYTLSLGLNGTKPYYNDRYTFVSETRAIAAISEVKWSDEKGWYITIVKRIAATDLNSLSVYISQIGLTLMNTNLISFSSIYTTDTTILPIPNITLYESPALGSNDLQPATTKFVQDTFAAFVEEGTWTPRIEGGNIAGSHTYLARYGSYKRIDKLVTIEGFCELSAKDPAAVGWTVVGGLPYGVSSKNNYTAIGKIVASNCAYGAGQQLTLFASRNAYYAVVRASSANNPLTYLPIETSLTNTSAFYIKLTYEIN